MRCGSRNISKTKLLLPKTLEIISLTCLWQKKTETSYCGPVPIRFLTQFFHIKILHYHLPISENPQTQRYTVKHKLLLEPYIGSVDILFNCEIYFAREKQYYICSNEIIQK